MLRSAIRFAACLMIAALGFSGTALSQETGDLPRLREKALELVNASRREHGLEPLTMGDALNQAAQKHAEDMLRRNYYAHESPEGKTVADRYREAGGSQWRLTAENIARCQGCPSPPTIDRIEKLHEGWMNSPEHRENILRRGLDRFGFGIVSDGDTLYAAQTFAGAGTSRDADPQEEASAMAPEEQNELAAERLNEVREAEKAPALEPDPALMQAAANLLPEQDRDVAGSSKPGNLMEALPADAREQWRSIAVLMASCGGCGRTPNASDVRSFLQQWLDDPQYRERLIERSFTDFGMIVRANGEGRKDAVLVLGQHR